MKCFFKGKSMALGGGILLGSCILLAIMISVLSPYDTTSQNADIQNSAASFVHLFGTDKFGRDIFVRVWTGTGISLRVGLFSALFIGIIGVFLGGIAGYAGGIVDILVMRFGDILDSIPSLLYVILIMLIMGANVGSVLLGICISGWVDLARVVRGEIRRLKAREFVSALKITGVGPIRLFFHHLLPNAAGPIIVNLTYVVPKAIFTEAFLSFVGVGISVPEVSLGALIQEARSQMWLYPMQMIYPIVILCGLILAMNLIGIGLEEGLIYREKG